MIERTDYFLFTRMNGLWQNHFADIPRKNSILISFGRKAKTRLGSITYDRDRNESNISINGMLQLPVIPEVVIDATIAHELIHYIHGFSSSLERKFSHPHKGGIILREMKARKLYVLNLESKRWLKANWRAVIADHY